MDKKIWQNLLWLESQEIVKNMFFKIHRKKLNSRRAYEITSSAKQSREYFRNAANSSFSVKPLLVFYGVSGLGRALALIMRLGSGEEKLNIGHGLTTVDWNSKLSGNINVALRNIGELQVRSTSGLFTDFIKNSLHLMCLHVRSESVDWRIPYPQPPKNNKFTFSEILSRLPDLDADLKQFSFDPLYSSINAMTFTENDGFQCTVLTKQLKPYSDWFKKHSYNITESEKWTTISCDSKNFELNPPQFVHSYIDKTFGSIPSLYLSKPFHNTFCYSQLGITFIASYYLGMLVRYYPTQWNQMITGGVADKFWPILNRLTTYVEQVFPELVIELVQNITKEN